MTNPGGGDVTGALFLFAVVFNDGDRDIPLPRRVVVFSNTDFKKFKVMISQKIGVEPHQIATFLIHRRKGRFSPGRKIPIDESTDFAALVRNSQDCHILAVLRKSPRRDRLPRRGIPQMQDSSREQELWDNHLLDRIRQLEIQEHELKLQEQELHMRMQMEMEQQYMMANYSWACTFLIKNCSGDVLMNNSSVDAFAKCGSIDMARRVFDRMPTRDIASWNAMISRFAMHGRVKQSLHVFHRLVENGFHRLVENGLKPSPITLVGVLSACNHESLVAEGQKYFDAMVGQFDIEPELEHYGCMVDLLARAGCIDETLDMVLNRMSCKPDAVI